MKRMLVKVKTTTEFKLSVDVPDDMNSRDLRSWFQTSDFDPRDQRLDEDVIDTVVTVVPVETDGQDANYTFDGKELHGEQEGEDLRSS